MRWIAASIASCTAGLNERAVPRSTTLSGMTFQVSPPWIWVMLTTALSSGWVLRLATVWSEVAMLRGADDGIDALMRHRRVRALALNRDLEHVAGGEHRSRPHREGADGQARPVVHAVDCLDGEAGKQPVLDHDAAAALVLLGRLEDEIDGAGEIAGFGEIARRAQQHRRVPVMAAGMHLAGDRRDVFEAVHLVDMERVHVGPQRDGAGGGGAPLKRADDARAGEAARDLDPVGLKLRGDEGGRLVLFEGGLGAGMDAPPPCRHIAVKFGNAVDDRHGLASRGIRPQDKGAGRRSIVLAQCQIERVGILGLLRLGQQPLLAQPMDDAAAVVGIGHDPIHVDVQGRLCVPIHGRRHRPLPPHDL